MINDDKESSEKFSNKHSKHLSKTRKEAYWDKINTTIESLKKSKHPIMGEDFNVLIEIQRSG